MEDYQIVNLIIISATVLWLYAIIFFFPRRYNVIDNKYEVKRIGFYYYVIEYGEKRRKKYFWNYTDCITYIEQRKKEDA